MEAILARSLTKLFDRLPVLDGASLSVPEGQRLVVFGPTGVGKTTLLFILAGLVRPDAGEVSLFGTKASGNGRFIPPEARSIGMVFQRALLWPHMSALQNVEFALCQSLLSRLERRRKALEALALFGVDGLASRRPDTLSGGQIQRVALARSIVASPRILLWDEPFTGLDAATRNVVAACAVDFMQKARTTLVAVSHHLEDAGALLAKCVRMEGGRIVPLG